MPLIVVFVLISIIAVICGARFGRPSETAEINRDIEPNKEEILAETTTVQAGRTYTVPEDGIYKIEVYSGEGGANKLSPNISGSDGCHAIGYVMAYAGEQIEVSTRQGGYSYSGGDFAALMGAGGNGICVASPHR